MGFTPDHDGIIVLEMTYNVLSGTLSNQPTKLAQFAVEKLPCYLREFI